MNHHDRGDRAAPMPADAADPVDLEFALLIMDDLDRELARLPLQGERPRRAISRGRH